MVTGKLAGEVLKAGIKSGGRKMAGNTLIDFFEQLGPKAAAAVRGVGKEAVEQGAGQAARNIFTNPSLITKGITAEGLAGAAMIAKKGQDISKVKGGIETAAKAANIIAPAIATTGALTYGENIVNSLFGQQNVGSQPFRGRKTGNLEFDSFIHQQALEQQRLESEMAVIRQKAVLGVPSPLEMAQAEKMATEAGEATNKEVLQVARSIYGTGLRA
tara:strand:- start:1989 stop:2636 length:648 start_codon:yes stop_codon:yes gene_type:complete